MILGSTPNAARAKELNIKFNWAKLPDSATMRVSACFPSLIERKRGSSKSQEVIFGSTPNAAKAKELNTEFKCADLHKSVNTRIAKTFPTLIERRRGNSQKGDGTWNENELAIQLFIRRAPVF